MQYALPPKKSKCSTTISTTRLFSRNHLKTNGRGICGLRSISASGNVALLLWVALSRQWDPAGVFLACVAVGTAAGFCTAGIYTRTLRTGRIQVLSSYCEYCEGRKKSYQCLVNAVWGSCSCGRGESKRGSRAKTFQVQEKACQRLERIVQGVKGTSVQPNRGAL